MIKLRFVTVLALFPLVLSLPAVASAQSTPPPPHVFIGTAWQDGRVAPYGTIITAMIDGEEKGSTEVHTEGRYDPLFVVRGDGDVVTFRIGSTTADQTAVWEKGGATILDLTVDSEIPLPGPLPPPGQ